MDSISDPLTVTDDLYAGDVVLVNKRLRDKTTGQDFWWKSFRVVMAQPVMRHYVELMVLKMHPTEKDYQTVRVPAEDTIVQKMPEAAWPQGVVAMRLKHLTTGLLKLG